MCSGGCCIKDLRWEGGKLQMLKGNAWSDVPGSPSTSLPPNLPPVDEEAEPTQSIACYKANGVWEVLKAFTDALVLSITGTNLTPLHPYQSFQNEYGIGLKADNFKLWEFMAEHYTDDPDVVTDWVEHEEAVKADFICLAQDAFSKFPLLSDDDYEWLAAYDFDSPSAVLDDFMTSALSVPEIAAWAEAASFHVFSQVGECDCAGSEPVPPPQTEPNEGEFGLYEGELIGSISTGMNPTDSRAAANPMGVKVSEVIYQGEQRDDGANWKYEVIVMWEATETITDITFDMIWKYLGTISDGSNVLSMTQTWYYSSAAGNNWAELAGFIGGQSKNDNDHAGLFGGAWNELKVPWDGSVPTVDARFLGLKIAFNLNKSNTPDADASWEMRINNFKIFADGGNYRATVVPLQFVPKVI